MDIREFDVHDTFTKYGSDAESDAGPDEFARPRGHARIRHQIRTFGHELKDSGVPHAS